MKFVALAAILAGSASAFAPSTASGRSVTFLNAEKSQALPFMNKPALVSAFYRSELYTVAVLLREIRSFLAVPKRMSHSIWFSPSFCSF